MSTLRDVVREHQSDPGRRIAQHLLATEVLELVHGREEATKTLAEHQAMRKPSLNKIAVDSDSGQDRITMTSSQVLGQPVAFVMHVAGLTTSKSEATRLIASGGVYMAVTPAGADVESLDFAQVSKGQVVEPSHLLAGRLIVRLGKWKVRSIEVVEDGQGDSA